MSQLALLAGSLAAILLLALAARLLRLGGGALTDDREAREMADAMLSGFEGERVWRDVRGAGAVIGGRGGGFALLRPHGAHFVARRIALPADARQSEASITLPAGEPLLGPITIQLASPDEARLLTSLLRARTDEAS